MPALPHEPKHGLFDYLAEPDRARAAERETQLRARYRLEPLARESTRALYRKNLYLIDILEEAVRGLPVPDPAAALSALDVGSQDWHYVFGLERWLRHDGGGDRRVSLRGVEVDGYGIYPDFRSRKDYAGAYAAQTGNPEVTYEVGDILDASGSGLDLLTVFYPFVTRHHLLLWGLPLRLFRPAGLAAKAASLLRPGGRLLVFTHTLKEHEAFLALGKGTGELELVKQGRALSNLVDFHEDVADRRYSVWRRV